jgi:tRNA nucleotidyltransferase/poly(A) polymerase
MYALEEGEGGAGLSVIDPAGGLKDAKKGLLKATGPDVFNEDPLRCLRAVRIAQQYGLKITKETKQRIKVESGLLKSVSPERVRDELLTIFASSGTSGALKELYELKIMDAVLPEFLDWTDIGGGYDLLTHTLKTVDEAEAFFTDAIEGGGLAGAELKAHLGKNVGSVERGALFKLAAFLHDAGKQLTIAVRSGRLRFIGHEYEGSIRVKEILRRLKMSRKAAALITSLVKNHHRVFSLAKLEKPSTRAKGHRGRARGGSGMPRARGRKGHEGRGGPRALESCQGPFKLLLRNLCEEEGEAAA